MASEDIRVQVNFDDEMAKQAPQAAGPQPAQSTPGGAQGSSQAPPPRPRGRMTLRELNGMGQMRMAEVTEDAAFTISKVMPGKYMVMVTGYGAYVKSVRLGETTVDGPVLNLNQGSGGAAVTVTLSSAYGEIGGTVQDDKGSRSGRARGHTRQAQQPANHAVGGERGRRDILDEIGGARDVSTAGGG